MTDVLNLLRRNLPSYAGLSFFEPLSIKKNIVLNNINFRYSDDMPWVLNNINLRFEVGSRIGFVGETGSSKSTLLDILMGLIPPINGELLDSGRVESLGWKAKTDLDKGVEKVYQWYLDNIA